MPGENPVLLQKQSSAAGPASTPEAACWDRAAALGFVGRSKAGDQLELRTRGRRRVSDRRVPCIPPCVLQFPSLVHGPVRQSVLQRATGRGFLAWPGWLNLGIALYRSTPGQPPGEHRRAPPEAFPEGLELATARVHQMLIQTCPW